VVAVSLPQNPKTPSVIEENNIRQSNVNRSIIKQKL
jgi:hypothetical protein